MDVKTQIANRLTELGVQFKNLQIEDGPERCGFSLDTNIGPFAIRANGRAKDANLVGSAAVVADWCKHRRETEAT